MQIAVTNQKTKSIRSASSTTAREPGMKIATAVASAANTRGNQENLDQRPGAHRPRAYRVSRAAGVGTQAELRRASRSTQPPKGGIEWDSE